MRKKYSVYGCYSNCRREFIIFNFYHFQLVKIKETAGLMLSQIKDFVCCCLWRSLLVLIFLNVSKRLLRAEKGQTKQHPFSKGFHCHVWNRLTHFPEANPTQQKIKPKIKKSPSCSCRYNSLVNSFIILKNNSPPLFKNILLGRSEYKICDAN